MRSRQRVILRIVAVVLAVSLGVIVELVGVGTAGASNPTSCTRTITGSSGPITVNNGELVCVSRAVVAANQQGFSIKSENGGGLVVVSSALRGGILSAGSFFLGVCATSLQSSIIALGDAGPVIIGWRAQGCGGNVTTDGLGVAFENGPGPIVVDGNRVGTQGSHTQQLDLHSNFVAVRVTQNAVYGSLHCEGSSPAPTGFGNVATDGKFDQCASL